MLCRPLRPLLLSLRDISQAPISCKISTASALYCGWEQRGVRASFLFSHNLHIQPNVPQGLLVRVPSLLAASDGWSERPRRLLHRARPRYVEVSPPQTPQDQGPKEEKMSLFQKFKAMYRDYWYVLVPVHVVTSAVWYGSFYYMARTGVDIAALAEMAHFSDETIDKIRRSSNSVAGHLAIAYLLYKVFTPLRYTVTVGGTTISINYLKKWGWIKPIPKSDELRKMYDDKKLQLRKKRDSLKERHELMKKTVMNKINSKKRMRKTSDLMKRMRKRFMKKG